MGNSTNNQTRKVFIKTHGCQMNEYDSSRMLDLLREQQETELVDTPENADLLLLNTCSIREKAQEKVFHQLGRWRAVKDSNPDVKIAVGGCVASQEGSAISKRAPFVDVIFGPQTLHKLPDMLNSSSRKTKVDISFPEIEKFDRLPLPKAESSQAFLTVMEGCSKYCSFCVVPFTRGEEISRDFDDILTEASHLADQGVREINLLGQNVNAYRGQSHTNQTIDLALLIRNIARIEGIDRIRFTTSHPIEFNQNLINIYNEVPELASHLHLPVQSGSDRILSAMKRGHTAIEYKSIIRKVVANRPNISLSSDFIVGFPGESDQDFADTLALVSKVGYASAYSFKYSPRPGTPAANAEQQVPEPVKSERLESLQQLLNAQQFAFNKNTEGKLVDVLVERAGGRVGQMAGRSPYMQAVNFIGEADQIGQIVSCRLSAARQNSMTGEIVNLKVAV